MSQHHRQGRLRRACAHVIAGLIVALCAAEGASAAPLPQGRFAGTTDPHISAASDINFRVSGQTIRDRIIYWRAACQSGSTFSAGTHTARVPVAGGGWHTGGSYDQAVSPGMSAHVTILEDQGHFTSPITAAGVWSVQVTVFTAGQQTDTCTTGPENWAAGTLGVTGHASPLIVPAGEKVAGAGYAQWETRAWQWDDEHLRYFPGVDSPAASRCVTAGETGPVWFLHGDTDQRFFDTRTCRVPAGHYLFLDTPSYECSTVEQPPFRATTTTGLEQCTTGHRVRVSLAPGRQGAQPIRDRGGHRRVHVPDARHRQLAGCPRRHLWPGDRVRAASDAPAPGTRTAYAGAGRVDQFPGHLVGIAVYNLTVG